MHPSVTTAACLKDAMGTGVLKVMLPSVTAAACSKDVTWHPHPNAMYFAGPGCTCIFLFLYFFLGLYRMYYNTS